MPDTAHASCPKCGDSLLPGKMYCPNCGLATIISGSERFAVDAYAEARVRQAVDARMADKDSLVRVIADDAEDVVWKRIGRYSWVAGTGLFLLGLWGLSSIQQAKNTIVNEAHARLDPVISDTEMRVKAAQKDIAQTNQKISTVKSQLDGTSKLAQQQSDRINGQAGEITTKLQQVQSASSRASELSTTYEKQAADFQRELTQMRTTAEAQNRRLEETQKQLSTRVDQFTQQIDRVSIQQAYPNLGKKLYVTYNGSAWKGVEGKKASDKWVNINLDQIAVGENRVTAPQLGSLSDQLEKRGYTPLPGAFGTGGSVTTGWGCYGGNQDGVFYFDRKHATEAEEVAKLATDTLHLQLPAIFSTTTPPSTSPLRFMMEHSGIDLQICVWRSFK